jgi:Papain family cysteine protease
LATLLGARLDGKDERSRQFQAPLAEDIRTVMHQHYGPVLSQWVGSCTGHSATQNLNCRPLHVSRTGYKNDGVAMTIYEHATTIDPWPGNYPPTDTGSSVLAAAKATQHYGYISSYRWAFGYDQMLAALMQRPVVIGTVWLDNMFHANRVGFLDASGPIVGGHAYLVIGYSRVFKYFTILNSWGIGFGRKGKARIKADDMRRLIEDDGEAVVYL